MMKFIRQVLESIRFAWQALRSNLLRTVLSLLGVTVGIFSIIAVFTMVDSLEASIRESLNFTGSNTVFVSKWSWNFSDQEYAWWKYFRRPAPSFAEFRFLEKNLENAEFIAISDGRGGQTIKNGNNSMTAGVRGISYQYNQITDMPIEKGRYFSPMEIESARNVVVVGSDIASNLFPFQEPVGQYIRIKGLRFQVIGVMERVGTGMFDIGGKPDIRCYIPYISFSKLFHTRYSEPNISVKGFDRDEHQQELEGELIGLMRTKRGLKPYQEDNFSINRPEAIQNLVAGIFSTLRGAGLIIALFSLLIGGFGIANIMFVSVKERTNLIGIQKSLGAKTYFILCQFLFEAVFLSLIGGLVGILLVWLLTFYPQETLDIQLTFRNVLIGLGVSSTIGLLSGIIPAWIAARMDPVMAIRSK
ncbi:putative ABC transport system permease protein [Siphonobacter aquaeclarae]|uniref:Putative ABC transport system permease protein n=2 Tax=Siphonobacter aquaeclarae TaxID=563176 RepID=A0A1G9NM63_9BACT|nr:putative ABC transport system permease protein [Siphonobacter aquaeclarae]